MSSTNVKTIGDLMSIAIQAEREAIRRYSQLAIKMHDAGNTSIAGLFERMVVEEKEHENLLVAWMTHEGIEENPEVGPVTWKDPGRPITFDDKARDPNMSSPYRALAFAVHNEDIAFRFYTHVAKNTASKSVRKYAEVLAREELGHAALLRAERRCAYLAERESKATEPILDPKIIQNESDLLEVAIHIDQHLLASMNNITEKMLEIKPLISETQQGISHSEKTLGAMPAAGAEVKNTLEQLRSYKLHLDKHATEPASEIKRLWTCCDRSFAFYDAIVKSTADEAIMLSAKKLTGSALDRIGTIKSIFGNLVFQDDSV